MSLCRWICLPALDLIFHICPWYNYKKNNFCYDIVFLFLSLFLGKKKKKLLMCPIHHVLKNNPTDYLWFKNFSEGSCITRLRAQACEFWQRAAEESPGYSNLTRKELDILKNFYWPVWTGNGKSDRSHRQAAVSSLLTFKCHLVSSENQGNANNRALGKRVLYQGYLLETNISWLPFL